MTTSPIASPDSPSDAQAHAVHAAGRRRFLYAGVAAAAAATGGGWAWRKYQQHAADSGASENFWAQNFETPDGTVLSMRSFLGKPLVLNFWATWCPPCIAELPLLNNFFRENASKGWQVVGLAVDKTPAVRAFLEHTPLTFPLGMAGAGGAELSRSLGNLAGGLPFTVLFAADGRILHRKIGQVTSQNLQQWLLAR